MRVIAGSLGGRNFSSPHGHRTHPMSDKIRGAMFNTLGDIGGLTVLDAFAGSGACGFEAISRGAADVLAIDIEQNAVKTITANIKLLGVAAQVRVRQINISSWLLHHPDKVFDIVIADPPYDDVRPKVLAELTTATTPGGILVLSLPGNMEPLELPHMQLASRKSYGDAMLAYYRHTD